MRRNRVLSRMTFPDFVANACCNPCCRDNGVVAQVQAAQDTGCCRCCCCCNCCGCGNCGNVGGASNGCGNVGGVSDRRCNRGSVGGAYDDHRPIWGGIGGAYSPYGCPCLDYPIIKRVE